MIAIKSGNVAEAKRYLGKDETPTQQIVLGLIAIAEKNTEKAAAFFKLAAALKGNPVTGNPSMPISYCEDVPSITK